MNKFCGKFMTPQVIKSEAINSIFTIDISVFDICWFFEKKNVKIYLDKITIVFSQRNDIL